MMIFKRVFFMKRIQLQSVIDYFSTLVKHYQAIQQKSQIPSLYKIVGKEICKDTSNELFVIQVYGKNVFLRMTPNELAADDKMLSGFSALDVRTITYFACKEHLKSDQQKTPQSKQNVLYRIIAMTFSRRHKKQMLVIEQENKAEIISASVSDISKNPEMIDGFSSRDAHQIGYVAGIEATLDNPKK
jgi:hypothetical protein